MELKRSENIETGNTRYYQDGTRISENKYRYLLDYNFASCFYTRSIGTIRRHYVTISKNRQLTFSDTHTTD